MLKYTLTSNKTRPEAEQMHINNYSTIYSSLALALASHRFLYWPRELTPVCELTVDGDGLCGRLGADGVAGGAGVVPGIAPSGRVDDQRATGDGDPGVGGDGCPIFAPQGRDLCPRRPRTAQRYISPLHRYGGNEQVDPGHCICRESQRKTFYRAAAAFLSPVSIELPPAKEPIERKRGGKID